MKRIWAAGEAYNDAPTAIIVEAGYDATDGIALTLHGTGLSVADPDAGTGNVLVTLSAGEGTLDVFPMPSFAGTVLGSGSASVTLEGTLAQINDLLAGSDGATVEYIAELDPSESTTLSLTINDQGNTGDGVPTPEEHTKTVPITVNSVNDAPTATITVDQYVALESTATALHGTGMSVADPDAGANDVEVTLEVGEGVLAVNPSSTGAIASDSGTSVTLTGTLDEINDVLAGNEDATVLYAPESTSTSASTPLTLSIDDLGNTGTGGFKTDSATATIVLESIKLDPLSPINEGDTFTITGSALELAGYDTLTVVLEVDLNFDGDTDDDGESATVSAVTGSCFTHTFGPVSDDGPSPGNDTSSDAITVSAKVQEYEDSNSVGATVHNVAPRFTDHPSLTFDLDEDGNRTVTVQAEFSDVASDRHTATVTWGDSTTTTTEDDSDDDSDTTVDITRDITSAANPLIQPLTVTIEDDDNGSATYSILELDVLRNIDDDDHNGTIDLQDQGFTDDDLRSLSLASLITGEMDPFKGDFVLSYDPDVVLLWDSQEKDTLMLPHGDTDLDGIQYSGQGTVWVEGISLEKTLVTMAWVADDDDSTVYGGAAHVTVWGIDLDIDSDNNQGFSAPARTEWEEELEDHEYAIGKMLTTEDAHFTPMWIQLPRGLDTNDPTIAIKVGIRDSGLSSGAANVWNTFKANPERVDALIGNGGNALGESYGGYTLDELNYDPETGGIIIWLEARHARVEHDTKVEVDRYGKPDNRHRATVCGLQIPDIFDEVKWMIVLPGSFYPVLNGSQTIRNAFAADLVYGERGSDGETDPANYPIGDPKFTMKLVQPEELQELLDASELDEDQKTYVMDVFYRVLPTVEDPLRGGVAGFGVGLYRDHVSGKYVLAFRGTNFTEMVDWVQNLSQVIAEHAKHYEAAMLVSHYLSQVPTPQGMQIAGQSLGGGLASAAAVATGIHADTFNASGLARDTLKKYGTDDELVAGSFARYDNADAHVDSYQVSWGHVRPDGTGDAPDILSYLQLYLNHQVGGIELIPDAIGTYHGIEGLHDFTAEEYEFVDALKGALCSVGSADLDLLAVLTSGLFTLELGDFFDQYIVLFPILLAVPGLNEELVMAAGGEMVDSHGFPSIYYGLMHGPDCNVYHVNPGNGGPQ